MASRTTCRGDRRWLKRVIAIALPLALGLIAGCAPVGRLGSHVDVQLNTAPAAAPAPPADSANDAPSLATIVDRQIQHGHYAEAEKSLRRYLSRHPGDRPAQALLRQLTADPERLLGPRRRLYVVQPGDSYSSLAARYLGDPGLFLVLARYNGSTNPSVVLVGQKLHLPMSARRGEGVNGHAVVEATAEDEQLSPGETRSGPGMTAAAPPAIDSPTTRASRLQDESVTLLNQGRKAEALTRLDQALVADPQLKSNGSASASMRRQLVAQYHQRAIVLYRDQQLDQAIALWDRVLAIDPKFEPAIVYRARALELQRRLRQL